MTNTESEQITEDQHYVPQFYLKQWLDGTSGFYPVKVEERIPPKLKVFDKKSDQSRFCYENFFYAQHTGVKDEVSQIIEKQFAEIEAIFSNELPALNETQSSEPETHPPLAENLPASALNESESFRASQKREDIVNSLSY